MHAFGSHSLGSKEFPLMFSDSIARAVVDLSDEQPGSASHLKLIGNVLIVHMIEAAAEAHVLAAKSGLKNEVLDLAIGTMFPGPLAIYSKKMVTGAYHKEKVSLPAPDDCIRC